MARAPTLLGSCQCGAVSFEIDRSAILTLYRCHCRECQKQAASAFGLSLKIGRGGLHLIGGELGQWQRVADSGKTSVANFCRGCGCRIFHGADDAAVISLKAGLLDAVSTLEPVGNIWTDSALPWIEATDGVCFARQPPSYEALELAWKRRG